MSRTLATLYLYTAGLLASLALLAVASWKGDLLWTGVLCAQCATIAWFMERLAKGRDP